MTTDAVRMSVPKTMRAVEQTAYGDTNVWRVTERPVPAPGPREVLVRVAAAGVDRGTWHLMTGRPLLVRPVIGLRRPRQPVPGLDLAGTVVAVGAEVTRFAVGDEVLGAGRGSFAEYACAPEHKLAHRPAALPATQAAALSISGMTAWQALHEAGRVAAGQRVLIIGASGGVGSFAVQIAVAAGATVTAVCSTPKVDMVRSLGATRVIDYRNEDVTATGERFDLVLDIGGCASIRTLRGLATATGTVVMVGGENDGRWLGATSRSIRAALLSSFVPQRLVMMVSKEHHRSIDPLVELVEQGKLVPQVDRVLPLDRAAEAVDLLASGRVRGKVVLDVRAAAPRPTAEATADRASP